MYALMTRVAAASICACVIWPAASAASRSAGVKKRGRFSSWSSPATSDAAVECTAPKSDMT